MVGTHCLWPAYLESKEAMRRGNPLRVLWLIAGLVLVGIGTLGLFLPVLPSTIFFICAAACFTRSSPRLEQWVLNLPRVGPLVRDYRSGLGMPRRTKQLVALIISVAVIASVLVVPPLLAKLVSLALGGTGVWFVLWSVPTREVVLAERARRAEQG